MSLYGCAIVLFSTRIVALNSASHIIYIILPKSWDNIALRVISPGQLCVFRESRNLLQSITKVTVLHVHLGNRQHRYRIQYLIKIIA